MRFALLISLSVFLSESVIAQHILWSRYPKDAQSIYSLSKRLDVDKEGNAYVLGIFSQHLALGPDTLTTPGSESNVFLAKYSAHGDLIWLKQFGQASVISQVGDVKVDGSGNVIIFCFFFYSTLFYNQTLQGGVLAKIDPSGQLIWAKSDPQFGLVTFSAMSQFGPCSRLAIDSVGNIIVLSAENLIGMGDPNHIYLFKFDSFGNKIWQQLIVTWYEYPFSQGVFPGLGGVALDSHGNIIVIGYFVDQITIGSTVLTNHSSNANSALGQLFIAKFSADGMLSWVQQGDYSALSAGYSLTTDPADNIYFTGMVYDGGVIAGTPTHAIGQNGFVAMMSPGGQIYWIKLFAPISGGFNSVRPYNIAKDPVGGLYLTGSFAGALNYQNFTSSQNQATRPFAMKITSAGDFLGIATADGGDNEFFQSVPDSLGNVYVAGTITGSFHIGSDSIKEPHNLESMLLLKIGAFPIVHDMFIQGPETACAGTVVALTAIPVPGATNYVWHLPAGITSTSGSSITSGNSISVMIDPAAIAPSITASSSVNGIDYESPPFQMHLTPQLAGTLSLAGPTSVCPHASNLAYSSTAVQNAIQYEWTLSGGVLGQSTDSLLTNRSLSVSSSFTAGSVSVTAKGLCNDLVSNMLEVTAIPSPGQPVLSGQQTVCTNLATLTYSIAPILNSQSYSWKVPSGLTVQSNQGTSLTVLTDPAFSSGYIKVAPNGLCGPGPQADSLLVTGIPLPAAASVPLGPVQVCTGNVHEQYTVNPIGDAAQYIWVIPDCFNSSGPMSSNSNSIMLDVIRATTGPVVVTGINQCNQPGPPAQLMVSAEDPLPVPLITKGECDIQLHTNGTMNIQWYKDQTTLPDTTTTIHVLDSGSFKVSVENFCGRVTSEPVIVRPVIPSNAFIPNVITPNGDGKNDIFQVDKSLLGSSLLIIDRWGSTVFKDEDYQNNWGGANLDAGVYFYSLQNKCYNPPPKGWVQIIK